MNGKTVLIVEDEPAIREMVGFALSRAGFEVDEAVDGAEAQERLAEDARLRVESRPGEGSRFTCDFPPERVIRRPAGPHAASA